MSLGAARRIERKQEAKDPQNAREPHVIELSEASFLRSTSPGYATAHLRRLTVDQSKTLPF